MSNSLNTTKGSPIKNLQAVWNIRSLKFVSNHLKIEYGMNLTPKINDVLDKAVFLLVLMGVQWNS